MIFIDKILPSSRDQLLLLPRFIKQLIVIIIDLMLCFLTVWLSFILRLEQWVILEGNQWFAFYFSIGIGIPLFTYFGLYKAIFRFIGYVAFTSMVKVFIYYAFIYLLIFTIIGIKGVPKSIGIIQPILLFCVIGSSRFFARYYLTKVFNVVNSSTPKKSPALIYGASFVGRELAASLMANKTIYLRGFIEDDVKLTGNIINGIPVYPNTNIKDLINKLKIKDVFLAKNFDSQITKISTITAFTECGVRVRKLPAMSEIISGRVVLSDLLDLDMNDLLDREVVPPNFNLLRKNIENKVVLVTGAGGSIGSELCRQVIKLQPKLLLLVENCEYNLYKIYEELNQLITSKVTANNLNVESTHLFKIIPLLASVQNEKLLCDIFSLHKPDCVFHAAAYKHVPLVEDNACEGVRNNVFGTLSCVNACLKTGVSSFILISTDKAVRPTNIMGATKRVAELILQAISDESVKNGYKTIFSMVRFGNVLGSSGSVAPLFREQINDGGPVTLTHKDITRYFMTIPEAAQLVIQSSAMAVGGDVFILDMGEPVRIYDLAVKMIRLSGHNLREDSHPNEGIEIKITGLRPGEKLFEELLIGATSSLTEHPKIFKAHEEFFSWEDLEPNLLKLSTAIESADVNLLTTILKVLVPSYKKMSY